MHGLNIKQRQINVKKSMAYELAHDLCTELHRGKAAVVAEQPFNMLRVVRKQWVHMEYRIGLERARTVNSTRIKELSAQLAFMRSLRFTAKPPTDQLEANVTFATADDFVRVAPTCYTMCVTYDFPKEKLHMMTSWMPKGGTVIIYEEG